MSQFIQHPAQSVKLSFAARKAAWLLSVTVLLAVAAVAVILLVSNGDNNNSSSASTPAPANTSYYGGHEEGTAGAATSGVILHSQTQIRRGVIAGPQAQTPAPRPFRGGGFNERYNGGLEEGTAGR
jgi:hypothetical protein